MVILISSKKDFILPHLCCILIFLLLTQNTTYFQKLQGFNPTQTLTQLRPLNLGLTCAARFAARSVLCHFDIQFAFTRALLLGLLLRAFAFVRRIVLPPACLGLALFSIFLFLFSHFVEDSRIWFPSHNHRRYHEKFQRV